MKFFLQESLDIAQRAQWEMFLQDTATTHHYLQYPLWAEVERAENQRASKPLFFWGEDAGQIGIAAVVLRKGLLLPGKAAYEINKGPVFSNPEVFVQSLPVLLQFLRRDALQVQVSPCWELASGGDDIETILERFRFVRKRILGMWATLRVDLTPSEDEILKSFRQTTRYEIKKGLKSEIITRDEDNPEGWRAFLYLHKEMSDRTGVASFRYEAIERMSQIWLRNGIGGTVIISRHQGIPIGGAIIIRWRDVAVYRAGGSSRQFPKFPTSQLLIWEAMKWARNQGCKTFDMGGYSLVARSGDALWGVNTFKRGFAPNADPVRFVAPHLWVPNQALYQFWIIIKKLKQMRRPASGKTPEMK